MPAAIAEPSGASGIVGDYLIGVAWLPLTEAHWSISDDREVEITAPPTASHIRLAENSLVDALGPWGSDLSFRSDRVHATFDGNRATVWPLSVGDHAFTWGSAGSIQLMERPMRISALPAAPGEVSFDFDDGDPRGQRMRVDALWFASQGFENPILVHEDETLALGLPGAGYIEYEVQHFSFITFMEGGEQWTKHVDSGTEFRELSPLERALSPWPSFDGTVYFAKNISALLDLDTAATVDFPVMANGTLHLVGLDWQWSSTFPAVTFTVAEVPIGNLSAFDSSANRLVHMYANHTNEWMNTTLFKENQSGFVLEGKINGHGTNALLYDEMMQIPGAQPGWVIWLSPREPAARCFYAASQNANGADHCGTQGMPGDVGEYSEDAIEKAFYYDGDLSYCHERTRSNWVADMVSKWNQSRIVFQDTLVEPTWGGATCWFDVSGNLNAGHHDRTYRHYHQDGSTHAYAYNDVTAQHECETYMDRVTAAFQHAWIHLDNLGSPWPDAFQVLHDEACWWVSGQDDVWGLSGPPGSLRWPMSIARHTIHATSPHEFGHTYGAEHDEAICIGGNIDTIMRRLADRCGERILQFSPENILLVSDHATYSQ